MSKCSIIEVLVGVFVSVIVIALGSFMLNRLSHQVRFYNRCNLVTASFSDVNGLRVGSDVRVSGVNIGSVTAMSLNSDNLPVVTLCIHKGLLLPVDSSASITYADLLGKRYIDIIPGADDNVLEDGSSLAHTSTVASPGIIINSLISNALK
ncbi:outer membrane lipid asymmetry maintenance protein MlaD [Anaplasma phagocytophilum]|uniref:outer membrane lipid asymmetry maintenance protein MlaD n=1 Tax=Anaplasma phagocytophilum TaxID=948 RepID=UPI00200C448C|nr:outer membrane lipid asymmetry maintenance protein MlaD [Anaplasma phagocytophilum]UQD54210.1 outer membrane lipid asymmetry maintenance protein MlaD [Anaplasma phagocytophilum]